MELRGKQVVVVGLAQTGIAVAKFCAARGARVIATDAKPAESLASAVATLTPLGTTFELGGHDEATFTSADLVVMSPGVPELNESTAARAAGVEVIAEIELAFRFFHPKATLIAITGTNGKSTTTALTGALCEASGRPTFCGGNLGNMPLIEAVDHPANTAGGLIVAEVAGFMLETCTSFRPHVGACLNITEDHLERYRTMARYAAMKTRVFQWQTAEDFAIANARCALTMAGARAAASQLMPFTPDGPLDRGAWLDPATNELVVRIGPAPPERFLRADLGLVGAHNADNAMAAYLAARLAGVPREAIRAGARRFRPQKHRMELVAELDDIEFYDDSKGTNVAAVAASMTGFPRPAVLIAGGVDKGGSYEPMFHALDGVARGLVLIGRAAPIIRAAAQAHGVTYPIIDATSLEHAVRLAVELAAPGDAVVLSPACASYDMFKNFEERGQTFRRAAAAIGARSISEPGSEEPG
jgi:UDP-N-acetylmuramoylalanine--D-glutamate ligase